MGKLVRALPEPVARPVEAFRRVAARRTDPDPPAPETTAALVDASSQRRCSRIGYALGPGRHHDMDVDPWAVVVRHGRWYLLCWSHRAQARRILRIDRVTSVELLDGTFSPPGDLDPLRDLEDQLSQGWPHAAEVEIEAPIDAVRSWLPRSLGRLEPLDDHRTRLVGSTEQPDWYAAQLAGIRVPFRVVGSAVLRDAVNAAGERLTRAALADADLAGTVRPGRGGRGPGG